MKTTPPFNYDPEFRLLLSNISKLPYLQRRIYLHKNTYPHFLYRYVSIDAKNEKSVEKLREVLVNSNLWLSSRDGFNDPFDTQAKLVIDGTPQQLRDKLNNGYKALAPGLGFKKRNQDINDLMANKSDMHKRLKASLLESLNATGACCFTSDPRNLLMWSHYANHHKGLVLQFEIARDSNTFLKSILVDYVKNYPIVNWANDTAEEIQKAFLHKYESWKYEKESRIIHPTGANTCLPFKAEALTAIIFGCNTNQDTLNKINEILIERRDKNLPKVSIFKATKHDAKYKIVIKRNV